MEKNLSSALKLNLGKANGKYCFSGCVPVELNHGLNPILLEYHDSEDAADGWADGVENLASDGVGGVENGEEEDVVGLLWLVGPTVQLLLDVLLGQDASCRGGGGGCGSCIGKVSSLTQFFDFFTTGDVEVS